MTLPAVLGFAALRDFYAAGGTPLDMAEEIAARMAASGDPAIFITPLDAERFRAAAAELMARAPEPNSLPLWGLPFAVKDNIDVAGLPTTAACPAFAYAPAKDATVVARLKAAGGIVIGKTNLDQFATGLNGSRSPYGAPRSVFDPAYVSGGSSSGSAVAVASGLAAFSLGTDTAGSGRVPAAFNNIVGVKPSPGRVPTTGVVPACRSIDVVTVFAASVADGIAARKVMEGFDAEDIYSRKAREIPVRGTLRLGVPAEAEREFFGNEAYRSLYTRAIERARGLGAEIVEFDYVPFRKAAALLYEGAFVAERHAAVKDFVGAHAADMDPTVRRIIEGAAAKSATDAFEDIYALAAYRRQAEATWATVDALLLPTSPDIQTVEAMLAEPVALNARFGRFTNFANFFGCSGIAVPAGFTEAGLPFGVMLIGPQDSDEALAPFADAMHRAAGTGAGLDRFAPLPPVHAREATGRVTIAVVGAHLRGMPLNRELTERDAVFIREDRTAPNYRLYALEGTVPLKPGLVRDISLVDGRGFEGPSIALELWSIDLAGFGGFMTGIPQPLGIGKVTLADGTLVAGFIAEVAALAGAREITSHGGWRNYLTALKAETAVA